jgi:hypothetical protein
MDLSRWNIPHLSKLRERTRDLRDFLGDVLEGDRELLNDPSRTETPREKFEVSSDWDELDHQLALLKPGASAEKILAEFAPYFEGALCIRTEGRGSKQKMRLTGFALFGQTFSPPDSKGADLDLGLAGLRSGFVLKGRIEPVLHKLRLGGVEGLQSASAFAFSPSDDSIYVLFCDRPHPWQVFAIENAYLSARDACNRRAPTRVSSRGLFK